VVHLAREPLAAVDADLDAERKPGLDPSIHEAEHGIDDVVIVVQALAGLRADLERSGLRVRAQAEGAAWLDAGEQRDEALTDVVLAGDFMASLSAFGDSR
jgi:hypothetical protein